MRRPRLRIAHFMIAAALVALGLTTMRLGMREFRVFVVALCFVPLLVPAALAFSSAHWSKVLKGLLAEPQGDPATQVEALKDVLTKRMLLDPELIARARKRLIELYRMQGRHEEAIVEARSVLRQLRVTHSYESDVRHAMADSLEALGRREEAEAERVEADACLDDAPGAHHAWRLRGIELDKTMRFREAAEAYERALERCHAKNEEAREELMMRLALARFNAGDAGASAAWAERVLAGEPSESGLRLAHRMAGVAYANLGDLDASERHRRSAYELTAAAEDLCLVAEVRRLRGDLDGAEALCLEAEALGGDATRQPLVGRAVVVRARGRLDEAIELMERARDVGALAVERFEARMQAALRMWIAGYKAELGRVGEGWVDLEEAVGVLGADPKLGLLCEAVAVRLLGAEGKGEEAARRSDRLRERLEELPGDNFTRLDAFELMGRGLLEAGELDRAEACWRQFLAIPHPPVGETVGRYFLGECLRQRGDAAGAREAFERALALGIESHTARLAGERLREMGLGVG